jgi:hypothetical protein
MSGQNDPQATNADEWAKVGLKSFKEKLKDWSEVITKMSIGGESWIEDQMSVDMVELIEESMGAIIWLNRYVDSRIQMGDITLVDIEDFAALNEIGELLILEGAADPFAEGSWTADQDFIEADSSKREKKMRQAIFMHVIAGEKEYVA